MINDMLFALWFFIPAGFANPTPIVVKHWLLLKRWNAPIDCGLTYRGHRLLGDSKTWRGLICAIIVGMLVFALQQQLAPHLGGFSDYLRAQGYMHWSPLLGALLGAGALLGDATESFFKRQHGIAPGQLWFPFDQVDYIIGACLLAAPIVILSARQYGLILVLWFMLHLLGTYVGFRLHLKEQAI